jgi:hexokinase
VRIKLTALINDTTGALIASNYIDPNTKIAVIFGTGCNAAYMETAGNIPKMKDLGLAPDQCMAINVSGRAWCCFRWVGSADSAVVALQCEWGAFDSFDHQHLREFGRAVRCPAPYILSS